MQTIESITPSRILYYEFFSNIFLYELLISHQDILQDQLTLLCKEPISQTLFYEQCTQMLQNHFLQVEQEYTQLFSSPFARNLSLYLSSYKEHTLGGKTLVLIREKLKAKGLILNRSISKENEDHFGILCLFMVFLLKENQLHEAKEAFISLILPIAEELISQAHSLDAKGFYFSAIKILESFVLVEKMICDVST